MGLIRSEAAYPAYRGLNQSLRPVFLALVLFLIPGTALSGQTSLVGEIRGLETRLEALELSGADRRDLLISLASLRSLAGDLPAAAEAWELAAQALPGSRDSRCLLEGARCLAAMGEWEKAMEYITAILLDTGAGGDMLRETRLLGAQIDAFRSLSTGGLEALLDQGDYTGREPLILYCLWKISGEEAYRTRLLSQYPGSPEGRILRGELVSAAPTAFWFLFPGREGIVTIQEAPPMASPIALPGTVPETAETTGMSGFLQTGLFSREENARAMEGRLQGAGFETRILRREINGTLYWAVLVPPGANPNATIIALKDAGFESFPVY